MVVDKNIAELIAVLEYKMADLLNQILSELKQDKAAYSEHFNDIGEYEAGCYRVYFGRVFQ